MKSQPLHSKTLESETIEGGTTPPTSPSVLQRHQLTLRSGGQSGVDRAALDFALDNGLPCHGWCPKDRWAEDGPISDRYPLTECESIDPAQRTELNVRDSDGTIVLTFGAPADGTKLTIECAIRYQKPLLVLNLKGNLDPNVLTKWIEKWSISDLNVAGPRESFSPGEVYSCARQALRQLFNF